MLRQRFKDFARATKSTGQERMSIVNQHIDLLIKAKHGDSALIAESKDSLNEAWADLLEMIETRTQMLAASWELQKFFHDCCDLLSRILEKQNSMSDELGRDAVSVSSLQRKHFNFEHDLQTLGTAVQSIQDEAAKLHSIYAGDRANEIRQRESEVLGAWRKLLSMCESRRGKLADTGDLFRFLNMVRDLMLWMEDTIRQMNTSEKPRDVSGVELLMNNHQSLKAEIDTREDNISVCINLGKELLARNHYASNEIKEKLLLLTNQRGVMMDRWEERWEHLQLILEVYQFARDAAVAETWIIAQEPYLLSQELGHTLDEVELLIKKHEAFEKSAVAQEERFAALERLTTLELKESKKREKEKLLQKEKEQIRLAMGEDTTDTEVSPLSEEQITSTTEEETIEARRRVPKTPEGRRPFEGILIRKYDWETTTKKSTNRSWEKMYVVLKGAFLLFYKDQKHYRQEPENFFHGELPVDVLRGSVEVAFDYTKRKHVFRLKLATGAEYLFQARDDEEMSEWMQQLNLAAREDQTSGPGHSQTLPARGDDKSDEPKRRSFFSLKKK